MPKHVLVLAGGDSEEREVSLRSGSAVQAALQAGGYQVSVANPADGLSELLPLMKSVSVVFPALHGAGGEDGELQLFLEQNGLKFVGSGSKASALCFDKARYTDFLKQNGILVPETRLLDYEQFGTSPLAQQPFVLKPNDGGSSIGTIIVRDTAKQDKTAVKNAFEQHGQLLLQPLITGTEITVGVLDKQSLPVVEIVPPTNQEFDYTNKYNGASQELCPPEHVSQADQAEAQSLAEHIHQLCDCRDMSRTDIIISQDDKLYVLETNTIPGLTDQSLLPKAAAVAGIKMTDLCDRLVRAVLAHD